MSVRMNLNLGDNLDEWVSNKADSLGIAKNAFVIMCVANARQQEEAQQAMSSANVEIYKKMLEAVQDEKK